MRRRIALGLIVAIGCEGGMDGEDAVAITAGPLLASTEATLFALGRTRDFQPMGGEGELAPGTPKTARWRVRDVAEGEHIADFAGFAAATFVAPNPPPFPSLAYCLSEVGARSIQVVSGGRAPSGITTTAGSGCPHVAIDRFIVSSGYAADPAARWFGAEDAANVVTLALDDWGAGAALEVDVDTGGSDPPLGVFAALPDVLGGARWPDVGAWPARITLTADGGGDALAYLVAKPGAVPSFWAAEVRGGAPVAGGARLWVTRPAAPAGCEGCVSLTLPAIEDTGWASTEGGFNRNHAELRCGDDGRGSPLRYQLFPGLTFDLSSIPAGATVVSAALRVHQTRVDGDAPFGALMRTVVAEHVRYTNMWECDEVAAVSGTIGQRLVSDTPALGWRTVAVTEAVLHEIAAARSRAQFRLRFAPQATDGDTSIDWVVFSSDDEPAPNEGRRPSLEVVYAP